MFNIPLLQHTRATIALIFSLALLVTPRDAAAATIVSNLGTATDGSAYINPSYIPGPPPTFTPNVTKVAVSFTTGTTAKQLQSVMLNELGTSGNPPMILSVFSDVSSAPGVIVGSPLEAVSPFNNNGIDGFYEFASSSGVLLDAATTYWLVASMATLAPGQGYLHLTTDGAQTSSDGWSIGDQAYADLGESFPWHSIGGGYTLQLSMDAIDVVAAPEPSRVLLLLGGLGAVITRRRRQTA
jgi:hypothetical protein